MTASNSTASGWSTYHGDVARTGCAPDGSSNITAANVAQLKELHSLEIGGCILSVPAVANGFVYVGTANGMQREQRVQANGGTFQKIDLATGEIVLTFGWETERTEGDIHGFTGMGCTPAIVDGLVYFSAFNGKLYCLDDASFELVWVTDLRCADPIQRQPITNTVGVDDDPPSAQAEGWCSPLVVNGRVFVGLGEGENPDLYAFIYCLDAKTGVVDWILCTNQLDPCVPINKPNVLPKAVVKCPLPSGFTTYDDPVPANMMGCCVWTAISYDAELNRLYCATGNFPNSEEEKLFGVQGNVLPAPGYAYSVMSLDAATGEIINIFQAPPESSYRCSDLDVDFGASPVIFMRGGQKLVAAACKNGGLFLLDAETLELVEWTQLLPFRNNAKNTGKTGEQITTVDPHGDDEANNPHPVVSNEQSNKTPAENFHGTYSTPAIDPKLGRIFVGTGGNNYHWVASGIDTPTTPFMRAYDWTELKDAWELDDGDPQRYVNAGAPKGPMYKQAGEAGLSSPAVVNDLVFCSTSKIALYAFSTADGTCLWEQALGMQSGGFSGGYGYCLGPAVCGDFVVAGALVNGRDGGVLKIYGLDQPAGPKA